MCLLQVKAAYKADMGTYECRARNQLGETMSDVVKVTVMLGKSKFYCILPIQKDKKILIHVHENNLSFRMFLSKKGRVTVNIYI